MNAYTMRTRLSFNKYLWIGRDELNRAIHLNEAVFENRGNEDNSIPPAAPVDFDFLARQAFLSFSAVSVGYPRSN